MKRIIILSVMCMLFFPWPIQAEGIVKPHHIYTYEKLEADLNALEKKTKISSSGKLGNPITAEIFGRHNWEKAITPFYLSAHIMAGSGLRLRY